jgi:hypothetical protein
MTRKFIEKGNPTFRRLHIMGIFSQEDMQRELLAIINVLNKKATVGKMRGSWRLQISEKLYTAKSTGKHEFPGEVFPRREWDIYGTVSLFTKKDMHPFYAKIESFRDGIHIRFGSPSHRLPDELKKEVWGDVNRDLAFTQDYKLIPSIVERILQAIEEYYKKTEGE